MGKGPADVLVYDSMATIITAIVEMQQQEEESQRKLLVAAAVSEDAGSAAEPATAMHQPRPAVVRPRPLKQQQSNGYKLRQNGLSAARSPFSWSQTAKQN